MYVPRHFEIAEREVLTAFMERHSFATLVTVADGAPIATPLPLLVKPEPEGYGRLVGHMARPNPQWRSFSAGAEALVIFEGPHAYISPAWYELSPSVPTWNYMIVHAYGLPRIIDDYAQVVELLHETVERYEREFEYRWEMQLSEDYLQRMVKGIVAFELQLTRVQGKFKLSQNRSAADRAGVVARLEQSADPLSRELGRQMRELVLEPTER